MNINESRPWKKIQKRVSIVILLAFLIGYPSWKYYLSGLKRDYTIAEVTGFFDLANGGSNVAFTYSVNDKTYKTSSGLKHFKKRPEVGMRFIVEFAERYGGKFGKVRPDLRVLDTSIEIPLNGWDELPPTLAFSR